MAFAGSGSGCVAIRRSGSVGRGGVGSVAVAGSGSVAFLRPRNVAAFRPRNVAAPLSPAVAIFFRPVGRAAPVPSRPAVSGRRPVRARAAGAGGRSGGGCTWHLRVRAGRLRAVRVRCGRVRGRGGLPGRVRARLAARAGHGAGPGRGRPGRATWRAAAGVISGSYRTGRRRPRRSWRYRRPTRVPGRPRARGMAWPAIGVRAFVTGIMPGSGSRLRPEGPGPDPLRRRGGRISPSGIRPIRIRPDGPERDPVPRGATSRAGPARVPLAGLRAAARPWRAWPFPWVG